MGEINNPTIKAPENPKLQQKTKNYQKDLNMTLRVGDPGIYKKGKGNRNPTARPESPIPK